MSTVPLNNHPLVGDELKYRNRWCTVVKIIKGATIQAQVVCDRKSKWILIHDGNRYNRDVETPWQETDDLNLAGRLNNGVWETNTRKAK